MRIYKWLAYTVVTLFVVLPLALGWTIATTSGSNWLVRTAIEWLELPITIDRVEGRLIDDIQFYEVAYQVDQQRAVIDQIQLRWSPWQLWTPELIVEQVKLNHVDLYLAETVASEPMEKSILPTIRVPFPINVAELNITQLTFHQRQTTRLQSIELQQLSMQASELRIERLTFNHEQLAAEIELNLTTTNDYPFGFELDWRYHPPHAPDSLAGSITATGTHESIDVKGMWAFHNGQQQTLTAHIEGLLTEPDYLVTAQLNALSVNQLKRIFATDVVLDSNYERLLEPLTFDGNLILTPTKATVLDGRINELPSYRDTPTATLLISAQIHQYRNVKSAPEKVQFDIEANTKGLDLSALTANESFQLAHLQLAANGALSDYQTNFTGSFDIAQLTPGLLTDTEIASFTLQAHGDLESLDVTTLTASHPNFTLDALAQLRWQDEFMANLDIRSLALASSQLNGYVSGNMQIDAKTLAVRQLQAHLNKVDFTATGDWRFDSQAIAAENPLRITLEAADVASVDGVSADFLEHASGPLSLTAVLSGNPKQAINIEVDTFNYSHEQIGTWRLYESAKLTIDTQTQLLNTDFFCLQRMSRWRGNELPASLCLHSEPVADEQHIVVIGKNLPLYLLNRLRQADVSERILGQADARASIAINRDDFTLLFTEGDISSDSSRIIALDEEFRSNIEFWQIAWQGNQHELRTDIVMQLPDELGALYGDLSIRDMQQVSGSLDLSLRDLALLNWWLPDLRYVNPRVYGSVTINGPVAALQVEGELEVAADEVGLSESGLLLTDLRFAVNDKDGFSDSLFIDGQALSGAGWVGLDGVVKPLARELELQLSGENFRVIQTPNVTVDIDPQLTLKAANDRIDIGGSLHIPSAKIIQPKLQSIVSPSADVRVYEAGQPLTESQADLYKIFADVNVSLGDDVAIDAYGFSGNVTGNLRLNENPEKALTANGTISVPSGDYEIYGQKLSIERGRLVYTGGPVDNPGLDLRVVRNTASMVPGENISVGAQVGGTLNTPLLRLFSSPSMPESSILSYLVLGRAPGAGGDTDNMKLQALLTLGSQGTDVMSKEFKDTFGFDDFGIDSTRDPQDTSFYIGKYLSPKLYVKYGIGLFENTNTFFIQYKLSEHYLLESTTSSEAQGGDIFYTIEK